MGLSLHLGLMALGVSFAGNFQQAYLLSVLNQPYLEIQQFINESTIARTGAPMAPITLNILWSIINVINPIAGIVGQLIAYLICDRIGRKQTSIVQCLLTVPGLLMSMCTKWFFPYYEFLIIGRFIWGIANGIAIVTQTVWVVEAAPTNQRGRVSSWQEGIATLGNLLTQAIGIPLANSTLWPFIFVLPLVVNLICMAVFVFVPESPQWLITKKNDSEAAMRAIAKYHGKNDESEILVEIRRFENCGQASNKQDEESSKGANGLDVMFRPWKANDAVSVVVRYGAWVGIMVKIAYVFTGARVIRSFNTYIYHSLGGWSVQFAQWGSLGNTIIRLPLAIIPIFLVERVGRRPLMLVTQLIAIIALATAMICIFIGEKAKWGTLFGISGLLFSTSVGIGAISRFYSAELVPRSLLLRTVTILSLIESALKIALDFGFYPLATTTGAYSMLIFLVPSVILFGLIYKYCPETRGKHINAVLNDMAEKLKVQVSFKV